MSKTIYVKKGYRSREDYLKHLSKVFDIPQYAINTIAEMLGPFEDFDGLLLTLDDIENYHIF